MPAYIDAVLREARTYPEGTEIETFYLGGGTPSLLPAPLLDKLLTGLRNHFSFSENAECTSEANPGTLTAAWLEAAVAGGINRLSMGLQAVQPHLLKTLGRIHSYEQAVQSVAMARAHGLTNINLDLMLGLPGQTLSDWHESLQAALSLEPQHLSCYGLIPEEGTPLYAALQEGSLVLPEEDVERQMYDDTIRILGEHGLAQYEISNFAKPGYACQHNLGYWRQVPYIGLGASAAGMLPDATGKAAYIRRTNPRTIGAYLRGDAPEVETISREDARFETLMLGLRTTEGVSEAAFFRMHSVTLESCYGPRLCALAEKGLLVAKNGQWALTRRGMDIQNSVLVELMD